jgi:hypothetical protein
MLEGIIKSKFKSPGSNSVQTTEKKYGKHFRIREGESQNSEISKPILSTIKDPQEERIHERKQNHRNSTSEMYLASIVPSIPSQRITPLSERKNFIPSFIAFAMSI